MYLIFIECLLNDRMQEDCFILLIKNMNMSSFWEENVSLSHPCLWDRARCPCGLRRPGRAMSQRCTPLPPPTDRPGWSEWMSCRLRLEQSSSQSVLLFFPSQRRLRWARWATGRAPGPGRGCCSRPRQCGQGVRREQVCRLICRPTSES